MQHSFIGFDNEPLLVLPVLVTNELLKLMLSLPFNLIALILQLFLILINRDTSAGTDSIKFTLKLWKVTFNCLYGFFGLISLFLNTMLLIIMRIVTSVQHIILYWIRMISQRLQMVRTNKPFRLWVLGRQSADYVLLIVVCGKIKGIRRSDITVEKWVILNYAEFLIGIEHITLEVFEELFRWRLLVLLPLFFLSPLFLCLFLLLI
jgi:hypothetical protein